jgi:hypothetical protein
VFKKTYSVLIKRNVPIRLVKFKYPDDAIKYEDPVSLAPLYCPIKLKGNTGVYSEPFIEFFYSKCKLDFLTGNAIVETVKQQWSHISENEDIAVSNCITVSPLVNGGKSVI